MSKSFILFVFLYLSLGIHTISASNHASLTISGYVAPINDILVEDLGLKAGIPGETLPTNQDIQMMKFKLNNNSSKGFYVNFSSTNQGLLVSKTDEEDRIPYTVSTAPDVQPVNAILGTAEPDPLRRVSLKEDVKLIFDTNVTQATNHRAYVLSIALASAANNPQARYSDNLTITIHNL